MQTFNSFVLLSISNSNVVPNMGCRPPVKQKNMPRISRPCCSDITVILSCPDQSNHQYRRVIVWSTKSKLWRGNVVLNHQDFKRVAITSRLCKGKLIGCTTKLYKEWSEVHSGCKQYRETEATNSIQAREVAFTVTSISA